MSYVIGVDEGVGPSVSAYVLQPKAPGLTFRCCVCTNTWKDMAPIYVMNPKQRPMDLRPCSRLCQRMGSWVLKWDVQGHEYYFDR